jgi:hypothetical protein
MLLIIFLGPLKDYVEFEVLTAVTGTDAVYSGINLLTFRKNLHRRSRTRRQQVPLKRR